MGLEKILDTLRDSFCDDAVESLSDLYAAFATD
jgi:hypothetical protein